MKFTHKVTARNLFRYKKRFFMTVIGVAGCTALLVTGFGLKDSISDIVSKQFGKVFTYDFLVTLSKESALKDAGFQALMDAPEQVDELPARYSRSSISLDVDGRELYDVYLFVPEDEARLDNFIDLHEPQKRRSRTADRRRRGHHGKVQRRSGPFARGHARRWKTAKAGRAHSPSRA